MSLAKSSGVTLNLKVEGRYPSDAPSYDIVVACSAQGDGDAKSKALDRVKATLTPAPIRAIEQWVAELSVITAGRSRDGMEAAVLVTAYTSRLRQYPADVVKHALLGKTWQWFPTWADLERICEASVAPRKHMIDALSKPDPEPEKEWRAPTLEEKQRMAELIREKFPSVSQEWRDRATNEMLSKPKAEQSAP